MADKRRLATEIDRCLKNVTERLDIFKETWDKVAYASNSNQKEKYEGDLKKEIKKLQRLRDQIKTWLANNDVKAQRAALSEKRREIEVQMERFKVIERETKTKAFSKEGLAAAARVDPREKERQKVRDWLNSSVEELKQQIEQYEAMIEAMNTGKKKRKGPNERETALNNSIERHQYHISKLEMLMRLIDNKTIHDLDKKIKEALEDDLKYYIEENQDDDFGENEYMYDDFEEILREAKTEMGAVDATKVRHEEAAKEKDLAKEKAKQEKLQKEKEQRLAEKKKEEATAKAEQEKAAAAKAEQDKKAAAAREAAAKKAAEPAVAKSPAQKLGGKNFAAVAGTQPPASPTNSQSLKGAAQPSPLMSSADPAHNKPGGSWTEPLQVNQQRTTNPPGSPAKVAGVSPNLLGGATLGGEANLSEGDESSAQSQNLQLLLVSSLNLPEPPEVHSGFKPQTPYNVPAYYPSQPPQHFTQPVFFTSLETDTLFFVFYHQQGTYNQYLAARELKKQAWRFHKKYLTWFQRFEEPKVITDEYEQGTYVYFDFEAGWCQRKKADFTFEYRFLEDHDLP